MTRLRLVTVVAALVSCGGPAPDPVTGSVQADTVGGAARGAAEAGGDTLSAARPHDATDESELARISSQGIGLVRRGCSLGDLRRALPASHSIGDPDDAFMVDLIAVPVIARGDTLYRVIFPAGEPVRDDANIDLVMTMNPRARTAEGIGPGTTLTEAARVYGEPTLSYSIHDESREYVAFPRQPESLRFRVRPASDEAPFAGAYTTSDEYNTTTTHDGDARIWMVFVDLRGTPE